MSTLPPTASPGALSRARRADEPSTRVLLIDDDVELRSALAERLREEGFDVSVASDGAEGLRIHRDRPVAVVITDLFMPGQEGMETLSILRSTEPQIKVIVISGGVARGGNYDFLGVARAIGADRCLKKPFDPERLVEALHELLPEVR